MARPTRLIVTARGRATPSCPLPPAPGGGRALLVGPGLRTGAPPGRACTVREPAPDRSPVRLSDDEGDL